MCVVSMISDHYMPRWPQPLLYPPPPIIYKDILELIEKARKYDELTGQPACPSPDKAKWVEEMYKMGNTTYSISSSISV